MCIRDRDTAPAPYLLDGGGVFETPPLILTHSKNGKGEASRRIHRWARREYLGKTS